MRSVNAPRVPHDATVEIGEGKKARAINLSTGGILISAEQPLDLGSAVHLKVNLKDGASPLDVNAQVLRRADGGVALRFVDLDDVAKRRIQRLVQKREPTQFGKRDVRIHLPSLSAPLRASARDLTERGVMIEAELPWLRLGSQVTTELSSDRACDGRVQWIGLDVTRSGSARLRIFVDLTEERADGTPVGPPPRVIDANDAVPVGEPEERRAPRPLRWLWPSLALGGFLATGLLSIALLRKPPAPVLLPTAPPEVEARAYKAPPTTKVPSETAEATAAPTPTPSAGPKPAPAKPARTSPRKPAHAKKHARGGSTPRAG
ncbi:MAG TPA: PilZ domain-containing protein [Polyangia bacterium]|nr:PilZ domain-containing protein [Polyangia bacterium]